MITGYDVCWNFELLIQDVLPVWGHGVGCAVATDNAEEEVHGELGKFDGSCSEQLIVHNSPQPNQVKSGVLGILMLGS